MSMKMVAQEKRGRVPDDYWCEGNWCHYTEAGCGCVIHECGDNPDVEFCPVHARAEGMREFVRAIVVWATHASAGGQVDWSYIGDRARAILRATEGRETP